MEMTKLRQLEAKVRELERALDIEKKSNIEAQRNIYKKDRKIKELVFAAEEVKQKFKDVEKTIVNLESDLRIYKRKFEEADEISKLNQNRFRKVHQMYLDETNKTDQYEALTRRRRADTNNTSLFVQA